MHLPSATTLPTPNARPIWQRLLILLCIFVGTRACCLAVAHVGANRMEARHQEAWRWIPDKTDLFPGAPPPSLLAPLVRWDANFYVAIARNGYPAPQGNRPVYHIAFFPLYPLAVRALSSTGLDIFWSAIAISNLALAGAVLLLGLCFREEEPDDGLRAALLLLTLPGAHFLSMPYPEGLFVLELVVAFLALARGQLLLCAFAGALACGTRSAGVVVGLALICEAWVQRRQLSAVLRYLGAALLSSAGVVAFSIFCKHRYNDWFAFATIQADYDRAMSLFGPVKAFLRFDLDPDYYLVTIGFILLCYQVFRHAREKVRSLPPAFLAWLPLSTGTLKANIRYQSANVPAILGLAKLLRKPQLLFVFLSISFPLLALEAYLFGNGMAHY